MMRRYLSNFMKIVKDERVIMAAKRYAIVGTGGRGLGIFARSLLSDFLDTAELVGSCSGWTRWRARV